MEDDLRKKQIAFDLGENALKEYYPKPKFTLNPKYYNKAYKDISKFMSRNGFDHSQYSVYVSRRELTDYDIMDLFGSMMQQMPWLPNCLIAIDVTDVGVRLNYKDFFDELQILYERDTQLPQLFKQKKFEEIKRTTKGLNDIVRQAEEKQRTSRALSNERIHQNINAEASMHRNFER